MEKSARLLSAASPEARRQELGDLQKRLTLIEKLITISATGAEIREYRRSPGRYRACVLADALAARFGANFEFSGLANLDQGISEAAEFYRLADLRSRAFVSNLTAAIPSRRKKPVILITGGYHQAAVQNELERRGYGCLVVTPASNPASAPNAYYSLLQDPKLRLEKWIGATRNALALPLLSQTSSSLADPDIIASYRGLVSHLIQAAYVPELLKNGPCPLQRLAARHRDAMAALGIRASIAWNRSTLVRDFYVLDISGTQLGIVVSRQPSPFTSEFGSLEVDGYHVLLCTRDEVQAWHKKSADRFAALRDQGFRRYFLTQAFSQVGVWLQNMAIGWVIYDHTHSVWLLSLSGFCSQIPVFILGLFVGVLIDRWSRRNVLIVIQALMSLVAFSFAALLWIGIYSVWVYLVLAVVFGVLNSFNLAGRQSFATEPIRDRNQLASGIALNTLFTQISRFVGPALAGVLFFWVGAESGFLLNGLSYIPMILVLASLRLPPKPAARKNKKFLEELKDGLVYAYGNYSTRLLLLQQALIALVAAPYVGLLPAFVNEVLSGDDFAKAGLAVSLGVGAMLTFLDRRPSRTVAGLEGRMPWFALVFGLGLTVFSVLHGLGASVPEYLLILMLTAYCLTALSASANAVLQGIAVEEKRGRLLSLFMLSNTGVAPFGALLAGFMADKIGLQQTFFIDGILCAAGSVWFYFRLLPRFQNETWPLYFSKGFSISRTPPILGFQKG